MRLCAKITIHTMVYFIKNIKHTDDKQEKLLLHSTVLFCIFSGLALVSFLFGSAYLYVHLFSVGLVIMIMYMFRITADKILLTYKRSMKAELYEAMAYTDIMTNLKNRNAFIEENYNRTVNNKCCCIALDINKLKWINDKFGHIYGDRMICSSAKIINNSFGDIGVCYRIGGDEFAIFCPDTDEYRIKAAVESMNSIIAKNNFDGEPKLSLACGYAFGNNETNTFLDLFNAADSNMYLHKQSGRAVAE